MSNRWLNWGTLRTRLTVWYVLVLGLTLLLFSGYLYLKLKHSLLVERQAALQVASAQARTYFQDYDENEKPAFPNTEEYHNTARHLSQSGFAVRIITSKGKVLDGFGEYRELPIQLPIRLGYVTLPTKKPQWYIYSQQIKADNGTIISWLQVGLSLESEQKTLSSFSKEIILGLPLVLFLAALGGLFLSNQALRPINRIVQTAQSISANDLSRRINYRGVADEVGRLAITFDRMLDRLQDAFDRERRFIADASHELRTPMTAIKGRIDVTLNRVRSPIEYENTLQALQQEVDRVIRLSTDLLFLARLDRGRLSWQTETLDLGELLATIIEQLQPLAELRNILLSADIQSGLSIKGEIDYLIRLFLNLLDNAIKYTPPGGKVRVRVQGKEAQVWVAVSDTGVGIAPEHLPHLFDRFYRVETSRSRNTGGAGLGLAIAKEIARSHGGTLSVQSQIGVGTTFTVQLPLQK